MESTPDTFYDLFLGYTAIWGIVILFLVCLMREQKRLKSEIVELYKRAESSRKNKAA